MASCAHVHRPSLHAVFVAIFCLCFSFEPAAQASKATLLQGKQITISVRKSSLTNILNQISKKSGITIYFVDTDLAAYNNINYEARDKDVTNILTDLFKDKDLVFEVISDKQIGVRKVKPKVISLLEERDTLVTISGVVTDEKGEPIPGVTVKVKDQNFGATTNEKGRFKIENIGTGTATLVLTNVAYLTQEVQVKGRTNIGTIKLKQYVSELDEMKVVAYGKSSQRLSVGNFTSVSREEIVRSPVNNPLLALQGRVPGMVISQSSGVPGSLPKIEIRGRNSINMGSGVLLYPEPLYIVDGIPIDPQVSGGPGSVGIAGTASTFSLLNVGDIESITVLKDADQTSIYGSRGANGVILITTRRGKAGKPTLDIKFASGISKVARKIDLMDSRQYLDMRYEALRNDGETGIPNTPMNVDLLKWDTTRNTDWQKELIGGMAHQIMAQASYTGGTPTVQYMVGAGYQRETSVSPGDFSDNKGSLHIGLTGTSADRKFYVDLKTNYLIDLNTLPTDDYTAEALTLAPIAPKLYNADGSLNFTDWLNPLWKTKAPYEFRNINITANLNTGYKFSDLLELKVSGGYSNVLGHSYYAVPFAALDPQSWAFSRRSASFTNTNSRSWIVEPQMLSNFSIGGISFSGIVGATMQQSKKEFENITAYGALSDELIKNLRSHTSFDANNTSTDYKYAAVFGRLNMNYLNRYILNGSIRRDGSSRFGPGNRFGNFASIGGAWIFTEEDFMRNVKFLDYGKIRASYGTTGGDGIGDYRYQELYTLTSSNYLGTRGLLSNGIFNSDYAWETTRKLEVGLETGMWDNRLLFTLSYYRNRSANQLIPFPYPIFAGLGSAITNLPALIQNKGLEFSLTTVNIKNSQFQWTTNFNISRNKNALIAYPDIENSPYNRNRLGAPLNSAIVYRYAGVDPETGEYEFFTKGGVKTKTPSEIDDKTEVMDLTPSFFGGLSNSFNYKGISVDILFQFTKQRGANYMATSSLPPGGYYAGNQPVDVLDRWQKVGDQVKFQRYNQNFSLFNSQRMALLDGDLAYSDASYIRLKNLSVSYTLPSSVIKKMAIQNLRVYVLCQNLLTITNYKGLDPETLSALSLPPLRVMTGGIQCTF
jgi:TonB-linked SusC/RagA family outer membrane protein